MQERRGTKKLFVWPDHVHRLTRLGRPRPKTTHRSAGYVDVLENSDFGEELLSLFSSKSSGILKRKFFLKINERWRQKKEEKQKWSNKKQKIIWLTDYLHTFRVASQLLEPILSSAERCSMSMIIVASPSLSHDLIFQPERNIWQNMTSLQRQSEVGWVGGRE